MYASGLSALKWLIVGILLRIFVSHLGILVGAYVLLSLIATSEIIAVSGLPKPSRKNLAEPRSYTRIRPQAINAPPESLLSTMKVQHEQSPKEIIDEYARSHPDAQEPVQATAPEIAYESHSSLNYDDIHAGELTYDILADNSNSIEVLEPKYEFQEFKFDSLNYQTIGAQATTENVAFNCPHCGASGQNDFSFCLGCGHAYAIG